jgi:hypothetical protein
MNVEYLPSFIKDLKVLRGNPVYQAIYAIAFEEITELLQRQQQPSIALISIRTASEAIGSNRTP